MADTFKVLGQQAPTARTLTTLYTVPGGTSTTVSTLTACNRGTAQCTVRVSVAVAGAADEVKQYLYYDVPIAPHDTLAVTIGLTLAATDVVRCYSSNGLVSFNLCGVEVT